MLSRAISLRYKLMAALIVIPIVGLSLFLLIAKGIFEKDKIAYVFDSTLAVSKTRAARVSSEITSVVSVTQAIILSYRSDTKNLAESGSYYFNRESKFETFEIYAWNSETSNYDRNVELAKPNGKRAIEGKEKFIKELVHAARIKPIAIRPVDLGGDRLLLAVRFGEVTDVKHVIAVALFDAAELTEIFTETGSQATFLTQKESGLPLLGRSENGREISPEQIWKALAGKKTPEGIEELKMNNGVQYLASFSDVGIADLVVISIAEKKAALAAVAILMRKSVLFFVSLIGIMIVLAVLASSRLTRALTRLSQAAQEIASGNFSIRVHAYSGGEVGILEKSFNAMAIQISRSLQESVEKARMETELATARAVQETLFPGQPGEPKSLASFGSIDIAGYYEPASECGGDWYYYYEQENKIYLWIGDATGHGAPAALLTSAARAVASVVSAGEPKPVAECMAVLNRAIFETSKGQMMMTFFIACIDKITGEMTYSNASHESPFVIHRSDLPLSRHDFIPLIEINNPRIGENRDQVFRFAKLNLDAGDTLVFYTDGLTELKNPEEKLWGERRFLQTMANSMANSVSESTPRLAEVSDTEAVEGAMARGDENGIQPGKIIDELLLVTKEFRENQPIDDDVTVVVCHFKGSRMSSLRKVA